MWYITWAHFPDKYKFLLLSGLEESDLQMIRASQRTMSRVISKVCAPIADLGARVMLGLVDNWVVFCITMKNTVYLQGVHFFFS